MHDMDRLMSAWDVLVTPAPAGASNLLTNLTGHPAVAIPCGFVKGQPLAVALLGRLYEEATPLALAAAYEAKTPWHTMNPRLAA
jgi:Asp-tRNA(Asn)/Glu-tRNA(Gln) amidotransferase A subunit family amidase